MATKRLKADGTTRISRIKNKVRPRTVSTYFTNLRTFFRYLVADGVIDESPVESIRPPIARQDQVQPFTREQVESLLTAAKKSMDPQRNEAIVFFLLDTGVRASELCNLKMRDMDIEWRRCRVLGKGNKHRSVYFGKNTIKAIWNYLRDEPRDDDDPIFTAKRGTKAGEALTRCGLLQLIWRLGRVAGIHSGASRIRRFIDMRVPPILLCSLVLCMSVSTFAAPGRSGPRAHTEYVPKWGYIDRIGKIVIQPQYGDAMEFSEGFPRIPPSPGPWGGHFLALSAHCCQFVSYGIMPSGRSFQGPATTPETSPK